MKIRSLNTIINSFTDGIKKNLGKRLADEMERQESRALHPKQQYLLSEKHLKNCKFVESRNAMLYYLPPNAITAEIGVYKGQFANEILCATNPDELYLIDSWENEFKGLHKEVTKKFSKEIGIGKIKIIRENSIVALNSFPNNYFDWVYLDSDHSYNYTLKELEILSNKLISKSDSH